MKTIVLLFLLTLVGNAANAQNELFENDSIFVNCKLDIPLTYKKKDKNEVLKKSKELHDQQLIYLTVSKNTGKIYYKKCYLRDDGEYYYLVSPEHAYSETFSAVFAPYKAKQNSFFNADCFEEILNKYPELVKSIEEVSLLEY
ncbi:MAG: hypothetical protein NXI10_13255 [bacterium]|nr:hypothetical protein [bacterium]